MFNKIKEFFCHHFYILCSKSTVQHPQPLEPEVKKFIFTPNNDDVRFVQTPFGARTVEKKKYPIRTQDTFNPLRREESIGTSNYVIPVIAGPLIAQDIQFYEEDHGREERTVITTTDDVRSSNVSVDTGYRSDPSPSYSPSVDSSPSSYTSGSSYSSDSGSSYSSSNSDNGSGW